MTGTSTRPSRLPAVLTSIGAALLWVFIAAVTVYNVANAAPMTAVEAVVDIAPAAVPTVLLGVLAVLAGRRRDGALLWTAILVAVLAMPLTVGLSLLVALLWLPAAIRLPARHTGPALLGWVALLGVVVLFVAAPTVALAHHDPRCWEYTEDAAGNRTYVEVSPPAGMTRGFAGPSLMGQETSSSGAVQVDPDSGEPVEGQVATGGTCRSDHTTPWQAGLTVLLSAGAGGLAWLRAPRR